MQKRKLEQPPHTDPQVHTGQRCFQRAGTWDSGTQVQEEAGVKWGCRRCDRNRKWWTPTATLSNMRLVCSCISTLSTNHLSFSVSRSLGTLGYNGLQINLKGKHSAPSRLAAVWVFCRWGYDAERCQARQRHAKMGRGTQNCDSRRRRLRKNITSNGLCQRWFSRGKNFHTNVINLIFYIYIFYIYIWSVLEGKHFNA